jgi:hypothetical protein
MKATKLWVALVTLAVALALVACAPEPTTDETPTPTPTVTLTTEPQATLTPTPAVSGPQPEATASPSPTKTPTPCPNYELEIDYFQVMEIEAGPLRDEIFYSGSIPFSADLATDPPGLRGNAQFEVTGDGAAGECTWERAGTTDVTLTGNLLADASGQRKLQIHLDIHWEEFETVGTSGECSGVVLGGLTAPVDTEAEQELPYEDGFKVTWPVAFPGAPLTGESSWTLHVLCDE